MGTDMQGLTLTGSTEATVHYDRAVRHLVRFQIEVVEAQASRAPPTLGARWPVSSGRTCR